MVRPMGEDISWFSVPKNEAARSAKAEHPARSSEPTPLGMQPAKEVKSDLEIESCMR